MKRLAATLAGVILTGTLLIAASTVLDPDEEKAGGATTVYATGRNAFSFPAANLSDEERRQFVIGNSFFRRNWVEAPASTGARDGLGPHFIARSCGGCHIQDGRGAPPSFANRISEDPVALLIRLSVPGKNEHGGPLPEPTYGDQFNNAAIQGIKPEGKVVVRYQEKSGRFADGTRYQLRVPHYRLTELGYGPMHPETQISPRIAPQVIGMGLLEAIREEDVLKNAAEQARRADGIKGRPNRVWDVIAQKEVLGRFGWKANVGSVAHQTGGAFIGDIGITSRHFPDEACSQSQTDCLSAPHGGKDEEKEIDDATFEHVVTYQSTVAVPARRNVDDPVARRGQTLFQQAQCAVCHRPQYTTGQSRFPALSEQKIFPYTDLLLHDMGPALADGRPDFAATGRQWRTPPLWGIGLIPDVNGHQFLLHDGRARGVLEAILWHGGEAQSARDQVLKMKRADREALVKFVESL